MADSSTDQALQLAVQHQQAGRLIEAERVYRQVLAQQPDNAFALHLLGLVAFQVGQTQPALELIGRAIAINPATPEFHLNLGIALHRSGRLGDAAGALRQSLRLNPLLPEAHFCLGNVLHDQGDLAEAIAAYSNAIQCRPDYLNAHVNLGNVLTRSRQYERAIESFKRALELQPDCYHAFACMGAALCDLGRLDEAVNACRASIRLKPDFAAAHNNLGNAYRDQMKFDDAIASFTEAIKCEPNHLEAMVNLGTALTNKCDYDQAIAAFDRALALKPDFPEAITNRGVVMKRLGRLDEAMAAFQRAMALKPDYAEAYHNAANVLIDRGRIDEAIAMFHQALHYHPELAESHWGLGEMALLRGDFERGWPKYECRLQSQEFRVSARRFSQPRWDGQPLRGRTLLLHPEQGFGDTIFFLRYLPLVEATGGRVVLECRPELWRLVKQMRADETIQVAIGQPLPRFDVQCSLASLPYVFATRDETIPGRAPYLRVDEAATTHWSEKLSGAPSGMRIGVTWAGSSSHKNDRNRSMTFAHVLRLAQGCDTCFYSLQKGPPAAQAQPPAEMKWLDFTGDFKDFIDTAALILELDLVITVDTAVAHLAGALGKPVWIMLPFIPDWRWQFDREDSPWYPSARLFRQKSPGNWDDVIGRVRAALTEVTSNET